MRSSIACARCRRSKVKCINNGVNTTCRACEATGRECTYPAPAGFGGAGMGGSTSAAKRDGHAGNAASEGTQIETPKRHPRPRRSGAASAGPSLPSKESPRALVDALDPTVLTPKVWTELFEIFQMHFSTELPFLHPPTFLKPLRQSTPQSSQGDGHAKAASPTPPGSPLLLLAFLTLTSRFHPALVNLHSPPSSSRPSNPLAAAEYYSAAAKSRLGGNYGDDLGRPSLERVQAVLMLALHEWGMCRGSKSWIMVGGAVRSAQILGMQVEEELDDMPLALSTALSVEARYMGLPKGQRGTGPAPSECEAFIEQEIRRRTFWSCFIMDRYLSSGKYRPQILYAADIRVQLPSSERAFLFGEKVRTHLLCDEEDDATRKLDQRSPHQASARPGSAYGQDKGGTHGREDDAPGKWEVGSDESTISRYIRVLNLYGKIVKWSCGGGRRREQHPPWDSRSRFFELQKLLATFKENLSRDLTLSPANISAHIASRTATPYTLLHIVLLLCHIVLNREYIPFLPIRCSKPQGPLDPPVFSPKEYEIPEGFWEASARELFKSSRDLIDLLRTSQEWGVLVETPIVGFAAYTVAFIGVYAINFPWMDLDGRMCSKTAQEDSGGFGAARKAVEIMGQMRTKLRMADGWFKTIKRVHIYFGRIKKDFKHNTKALERSAADGSDASETYSHLSLREGGAGGGLEEFKLIEKTIREFGSIEDEEADMMDVDPDTNPLEEGSDAGSAAVKSEGMDIPDGSPDGSSMRPDRWNAINSGANVPVTNGNVRSGNSAAQYAASDPWQARAGGSAVTSSTAAAPFAFPQQQEGLSASPAFHSVNHNASPRPYSPSQQVQSASLNLQQQVQQGHQQPAAMIAPADMTEDWLNSLDTRFGGDDLAAFVAGNSWSEFGEMGGWLSTVWGGPQAANAV